MSLFFCVSPIKHSVRHYGIMVSIFPEPLIPGWECALEGILATRSQKDSKQCYHHTRPSEHLLFNAYQLTVLAGLPFLLSGFPQALTYPVCIRELHHMPWKDHPEMQWHSARHGFLCRCLWISQSSAGLNWAQLGLLWFLGSSMHLSSSLGQWFPRVNSSLGRHVPRRTRLTI